MVTINLSRDNLFDDIGILRLKDSYMLESEQSPQHRFKYVCEKMGTNLEHSQRLYDYVSKHWLSLSTPILSYGKAKHGLPISCYLSYMNDTREGLIDTLSEVNCLSMLGGGCGIGCGIRTSDDKSTGVMPHLNVYDACSLAYKQDGVRRGSYAIYLDIDHPEILQFLEMRKPTGDHNIRCLNLHHAVNITDKFMKIIENCSTEYGHNDDWELIDPHSKKVKAVISAKDLWQRILETRVRTGEPYICFIDTCRAKMQPFQKALGLTINQSNLCSEIILPTDKERTAVCCLSSLNLSYYDTWKNNTSFIYDVAEMLDNALNIFVQKSIDIPYIQRASISAQKERSIGIGVMGFHDFLQQHKIPFESEEASLKNIEIFKHIKKYVDDANFKLGMARGEPFDCLKTGRRFANTIAIAPTATSSIIMGNTSPCIEPYRANVYMQDTISGTHETINKQLLKLPIFRYPFNKFSSKGEPTTRAKSILHTIALNNGSIQGNPLFTKEEQAVFKTAFEIDQRWILRHAIDRQPFIDQSQSLNLFLYPSINISLLHEYHFMAWKQGLKTLYYCRSTKITSDINHTRGEAPGVRTPEKKEKEFVCSRNKNDSGECMACE